MEVLPLFKNNKEKKYFFFVVFLVFTFNLYLIFINYQNFKEEEVFQTDAIILNIYKKKNHQILKIKTDNFICFTSTNLETKYKKLQEINLYLITKKISYYSFLKGFYTKNFNLKLLPHKDTLKHNIYDKINTQHINKDLSSVFTALFLAIPIENNIRTLCTNLGISHLIAISGFHLGIMALVLYYLLNLIYKPFHQKYIPYRNKKFDLTIIIIIILFGYLLLTDLVPSLLRAFTMFIFSIFILRNNIKLLSFETLFIIVLLIIAIFPKLLFSLSLWFSITGVFYIFLFIKYFKDLNKYIQFIIFNFWIYLAINPIVHYFFGTTTYEQLYSPILTVLFTVFYPITALLHIIGYGGILDGIILLGLDMEIKSYELFTPIWFFTIYLIVSFYSIISKKGFITLNILFVLFNLWLFLFNINQ